MVELMRVAPAHTHAGGAQLGGGMTQVTVGDTYTPPPGRVVTFDVRLTVFNISQIDTPGQRFTADIYACATANNHRAILEAAGQYEAFNPHLQWKDAEVLEVSSDWNRNNVRDDIEFHFRGRLGFTEIFELEAFPFDVQSLSMAVQSGVPAEGDAGAPLLVELVPVRADVYRTRVKNDPGPLIFLKGSFLLSSSWRYRGFSIQRWLSHPTFSAKGKQYRYLQFSLHFQRVAEYYIWNILVPLFLLTCLGFCQFSMDVVGSAADRFSLSVTLLLTAAAYKIMVASTLPVVNYLTWLDVYVFTCFLLLVLLTVETAAVSSLGAERAYDVDHILAYALTAPWAAFNLAFWLGAVWYKHSARGAISPRVATDNRDFRVGYDVMAQKEV